MTFLWPGTIQLQSMPLSTSKKLFVVCADGLRAWHGAIEEHYAHWRCGGENLYLIDRDDNGRIIKAAELDVIMVQEIMETWVRGG